MRILGIDVVVLASMPEDELLLVSPKFRPDGSLDAEKTRQASVRLVNFQTPWSRNASRHGE